MNKCIESSSGRSCVADYTVTAINCSQEMLKMIVDNAVKQGMSFAHTLPSFLPHSFMSFALRFLVRFPR